jgi:hypothetical protein
MRQFSGSIQKKRVYYIILARLTMLELLVLYIPALVMNIYGLYTFKPNEQLYYIGIDSLVLIATATILIVVTLA